MPSTRAWYRHSRIVIDHPLYDSRQQMHADKRPPEVWANSRKDKIKLFCVPCLDILIDEEIIQDDRRLERGEIQSRRSKEQIILGLFNIPPTEPHNWLENRKATVLSHLNNCLKQPADIRQRAGDELEASKASRHTEETPRAARIYSYNTAAHATAGPPPPEPMVISPQPVRFHSRPSVLQYQQAPEMLSVEEQMDLQRRFRSGSEMPIPYLASSQPVPAASSSGNLNLAHIPHATYPPHMVAHWDDPTDPFLGSVRSASVARSLSRTESLRSFSDSRPESVSSFASSKRIRTGYSSRTQGDSLKRTASQRDTSESHRPWTEKDQESLDISIARLIVYGDLPLSVAENPELVNLVLQLQPRAKVPSRKKLTQTIIPRLVKIKRAEAQQNAAGSLLTVQCDGWTGDNNHHLVAFMATSPTDVNTVKVYDTTTERKNAENLLAKMEAVIAILESQWRAEVTSLTSDASGESRSARRQLQEKFPRLVVPDCFAHQIALILGNYLSTEGTDFLHVAANANELITWLRSKSAITGLIHEECVHRNRKPMSIIRPVPTRWTAHYLAFDRLITLRSILTSVIDVDEGKAAKDRVIITQTLSTTAREKAEKMIQFIQDPQFWLSLTRIVRHLRPLAIAANATQGDHTRLDDVGLTLGKLLLDFSKMDEPQVKKSVMDSIERRWAKSDRDVIVAAIFLNPLYKTDLFRLTATRTSIAAMDDLLTRLWRRFYDEGPPDELSIDLEAYMECTGDYRFMKATCDKHIFNHKTKGTPLNPIEVYHKMGSFTNGMRAEQLSPVVRLAVRILSICANSASCERLFSSFGLILTKLRTRLTMETMVNLAELKMFIRDEHRRDNDLQKEIRRRFFGHRQTSVSDADATHDRINTPLVDVQPPPADEQCQSGVSNAADVDVITPSAPTEGTPSGSTGNVESSGRPRGLNAIASRLSRLAAEDYAEDIAENTRRRRQPANPTSLDDAFKVKMQDLFDFERPLWKEMESRIASNRLETELELYELLDVDAPGELDPDVDDSIAEFVGL